MTLAERLAEHKKDVESRKKWVLKRSVRHWQLCMMDAGKCRSCGKPREINPKTGRLYYLCPACHAKYVARMAVYMRDRRARKCAK